MRMNPTYSTTNFGDLQLAVESLSGGNNTVIFDDEGLPSIMVALPKMTNAELMPGGTDQTHHAWIVDNEIVDVIFVSKYQNVTFRDRGYSLPMRLPRNHITFDQAMTFCRNKGQGHHLMTNAMFAAIALLTQRMGNEPRGNNSWGRDFSFIHEKGFSPSDEVDASGRTLRTVTGSGPSSFYHDFTRDGIADLNGNVWEWVSGFRIVNGEIQVIPYGNAMKNNSSHADTSTLWRAIDQNGNMVMPGTPGTLKYDRVGNVFQVGPTIDNPRISASNTFRTIGAKTGATIPNLLRLLGLFPPADVSNISRGNFWCNNDGERLPLRGGDWHNGSGAGVFALNVNTARCNSSWNVGFRSAFVSL